ncbi:MAG: DNA topoisomerase III [Bacteroidetes bacterium RIFOXYA12_FULL_35_11]|nr:MAG: DNA topoisomerase III [Bacteroidetes bacterium GWF2_35_48]OFY73251.1 MAG: DNA topoisomerase III [Bacteroidetes bacterium RIFOXYA12_FULL_35_11]HBX52924.1 DNA topoisomerase III [Bacteroidales bacterium]
MKLCIAEKPSVGKELARILGANSRRDGYIEGNGYFISWTFGHLCTLKTPDDYTEEWKRWSLWNLPMIPQRFQIKVINDKGVQKQFDTLKSLIEQCDEVINCGDAGIEGELIQRWVLSLAGCKKQVKRLWISSLTDEAIKEGFQKLKDSKDYDLLYAAGNARAIGDWLLGMNASRLYTTKYAQGKGVLSIGRVQTPTLALIVSRHLEILNFKPEIYWELKTKYREVIFNSTKRKFPKQEDALVILEEIKDKDFEIVSSTKKKANEHPQPLFDLTSLQVECNKKFSFTAEDTLKYVQHLYEQKFVSYPRVDTSYLPEAMHEKIPSLLKGLKPYTPFTEPLLKNTIRKSKKVFDDSKITDHHAIIPTGINPSSGLPVQEKQVYDAIARRFIAAFYPDCVASNTTVIGNVDEHEFSATGKVILEPGWRILYPKKEDDSKDDELQEMPEFKKGEHGPHQPDLQEKQTQPPKPHTEATLLRAMETAGKQVDDPELRDAMKENGIGRPSTRANIIETLFKRNYIIRQRKSIMPTNTGIGLIGTINNELLKSVELTGLWEKKLRLIEKGNYDPHIFLDEMKKMVSELVEEVRKETGKRISVEQPEQKGQANETIKEKPDAEKLNAKTNCPKCKSGEIIKGKTAYGCSAYQQGCNFKIPFELFGKKLSEKQIFTLIQKGKTSIIKGFTVNNNKEDGILILNNNFDVSFEKKEEKSTKEKAEKPEILVCPKCKKGKMIKGKTAWGCSAYKEGCTFIIPFEMLQKSYNSEILTKKVLDEIVSGNKKLF